MKYEFLHVLVVFDSNIHDFEKARVTKVQGRGYIHPQPNWIEFLDEKGKQGFSLAGVVTQVSVGTVGFMAILQRPIK